MVLFFKQFGNFILILFYIKATKNAKYRLQLI